MKDKKKQKEKVSSIEEIKNNIKDIIEVLRGFNKEIKHCREEIEKFERGE